MIVGSINSIGPKGLMLFIDYPLLYLKDIIMKDKKMVIESVLASDAKALTAIQKKINQWMTVGLFIKVQIHSTNEYIVYHICLRKEA
tara:strand:+ start:3403 stop:3663 length:261 start_codon:yes stop_codon:yes gene_type:complete